MERSDLNGDVSHAILMSRSPFSSMPNDRSGSGGRMTILTFGARLRSARSSGGTSRRSANSGALMEKVREDVA
jgi:hypothetical protein